MDKNEDYSVFSSDFVFDLPSVLEQEESRPELISRETKYQKIDCRGASQGSHQQEDTKEESLIGSSTVGSSRGLCASVVMVNDETNQSQDSISQSSFAYSWLNTLSSIPIWGLLFADSTYDVTQSESQPEEVVATPTQYDEAVDADDSFTTCVTPEECSGFLTSCLTSQECSGMSVPDGEKELCTICLRVPRKPQRLKCNHVFCERPCLKNWTRRSTVCPNCRNPIGNSSVTRDMTLSMVLNDNEIADMAYELDSFANSDETRGHYSSNNSASSFLSFNLTLFGYPLFGTRRVNARVRPGLDLFGTPFPDTVAARMSRDQRRFRGANRPRLREQEEGLSNITKILIFLCLIIVLITVFLVIVRVQSPAYFRSRLSQAYGEKSLSAFSSSSGGPYYYYYDENYTANEIRSHEEQKVDDILDPLSSLPSIF